MQLENNPAFTLPAWMQNRLQNRASVSSITTLPPELLLALNNGWVIDPVLALSRHAFIEAHLGRSIMNLEDLEEWISDHNDNNWSLLTGVESGVIALDVPCDTAPATLRLLSRDDYYWHKTLQFQDGNRRNFLFSYRASRPLLDMSLISGLRLHNGSRILIPPSRCGLEKLTYSNLNARILDTPEWMLRGDLWERSFCTSEYEEPP